MTLPVGSTAFTTPRLGSASSPLAAISTWRRPRLEKSHGAVTRGGAAATMPVHATRLFPDDAARSRLLGRAGFGWSQAAHVDLADRGWDGWVAAQLDPASLTDPEGDAWCARATSHGLGAAELLRSFDGPVRDLRRLTLARAIHSRRQLFERVVEFFNDWFHVDQERGECRIHKTIQDREAIRRHALGRFRDLLGAVTKSGAMLEYLDNRSNVAAAPNENFARELLELHTIGVGEYDERDVREVARCFTGWTMFPRTDPRWGDFVFHPELHDDGAKVVLGATIEAGGGIADGEKVLDLVAAHPATGRRIAERMAARFLGENAPPEAVVAAQHAYSRSGGDVRAMLRVVLRREQFDAAEARGSRRFLRPFDLVAALVRASGAVVEDHGGLIDELAVLGHTPFAWPTPDGYPDRRAHWESSFAARCALCERFFLGVVPGVTIVSPSPLELGRSDRRDGVAVALNARWLDGRLCVAEREVLARRARDLQPLDRAGERRPLDDQGWRRVWALAACSPGFSEV